MSACPLTLRSSSYAGVFYAFFAAGVSLSHLNVLLRVIPEETRPQYISYYTALMNAGAFVAPLIGVQLANHFGLTPVLVGCGLLASLGGLSFTLWPVKIADPLRAGRRRGSLR